MNAETVNALLDTTRSMLDAARAADWNSVTSLDEQRHRLLEPGRQNTGGSDSTAPDAATVAALRAADGELMEVAREARRIISEHTHHVHAEYEAHRTYASVMESILKDDQKK